MRILVVDDHHPTIELMRLTLVAFGYSVLSAASVAEALEIAASHRPDLILSDLTFSSAAGLDGDGNALARAIRSRDDQAPIGLLAVTGAVSPSARQAALDSGFDGVVTKPFDVVSLIDRIEALGRERRAP